jgi:hypothetical protein
MHLNVVIVRIIELVKIVISHPPQFCEGLDLLLSIPLGFIENSPSTETALNLQENLREESSLVLDRFFGNPGQH